MNDLTTSDFSERLKEFEEHIVRAMNGFDGMESAAKAVAKRLTALQNVGERS
ncbi:MAG: hypothetical protein HFI68_12435 [Lachnospiraceae bacterium]|nr:hypothetical protein [Lachnospiraceae bacterium]